MRLHTRTPVQTAGRKGLRKHADTRRQRILDVLKAADATLEEVAQRLQEPEHKVRYAITVLETLQRVHICGWDLVETMKYEMRVPRYRHGPGRNVPPPLARIGALKRLNLSPLDFNPGADLQAVTVIWGLCSMTETDHAQE